ncbi:four-carbon acid sugar kinase family protein [Ornithinimicrobium faecis]|uniref:Four-carbon acid sugar kinase family protein n=1 Tax=Ornithinimicrobium faecis TaxID=2934158 RepID=A0ABY4YQY5_9MICO|nr:four-carbon acid sugar kinase family protein [Ornithinimicrobium sp. HY1793]USQ79168.1 four-carbon acid sugar kinase family protein [Ornithinimicrobium sp. HY1793]
MDVFFVADDFTGGVDVLLQAARCGEPATMFLSEESFLAADASELRTCTGVATTFRRSAPEEVSDSLRRILDHALTQEPRVVQYKICSTADSSPTRGSIRPPFAQFLERGAERIALWAAQPGLRRFTAFAHHFANDRGTVYRLDRQPTMANHPSTPMRESDLRLHFAEQIGEAVGSITLEDLRQQERLSLAWEREAAAGHRLVVLDAVHPDDLTTHGTFLAGEAPAYVIGSGGATLGLGAGLGWREDPAHQVSTQAASGPVLVVAGSCSELTAAQIARVEERSDWSVLAWDPAAGAPETVATEANQLLASGQHVLVHSGGASPARVEASAGLGTLVPTGLAHIVSHNLGQFARLVVAGGDTSGDVLTLLGATKLTTVAVLDRDTCLCLVDGIGGSTQEVVLKGGQIGSVDFFVHAALGEESNGNGDR